MKTARTLWHVTQFYLAVAVRQRVGWALVVVGAVLTLGGSIAREFNFGSAELRFLIDYAASVMGGIGALAGALLLPALLGDSLRNGTAVALQMHGAPRWSLLAGSVGSVVVVLGWLLVVCALCFAGLLIRMGHAEGLALAGNLVARSALPLLVVVGASALASAICRGAVLATLLTLALAVAAHLGTALEHAIARSTGAARIGWGLFRLVVPDFSLCERMPYEWALAYAGVFAALYGLAALWVFSRRED